GGLSPLSITTDWHYDSLGRLLTLDYTDGTHLTYGYDAGGRPNGVAATRGGASWSYVDRIAYDVLGERAAIGYGNGVQTTYAYEPASRRLHEVDTDSPWAEALQRLQFTYDTVGNVRTLATGTPEGFGGGLGGELAESFDYDDLDQLTHASG